MPIGWLEVVAAAIAVVIAILTVRKRQRDAYLVVGLVLGGLLMLMGRAFAPGGGVTRDVLRLSGAAIMLAACLFGPLHRPRRP